MTTRRVYNVDPIQEALCEVRFRSPTKGWAVVPGQLYERLRTRFPAEPEQEGQRQALQFKTPGGPAAEIVMSQGPGAIRLQSDDGNTRLRVSQGALSVHVLPPYPQWPEFSTIIREVLDAFDDVSSEVIDVERIGVRYINRIAGPSHASEISSYFVVAPLAFPGVDVTLHNFLGRTEHQVGDDPNRKLIATFASTQSDDDTPAFMLDLDVIAENLTDVCDVDAAMDIAGQLRDIERDVFEASITNEARDAFGGYKEVPIS
jgi:uncharacterized protein (TIGR04255 family)